MSMFKARPNWALVAHGGAGVIERTPLNAEQESAYRLAMAGVAQHGAELLAEGGSAIDAVEAAIRRMEDDPLFNAGRGAVFTADGLIELDASLMDGRTLGAGAVAGVSRTRHPISLARAVMQHSPHVFLIGAAADDFAGARGLEQAASGWFFTEPRWRSLEKALQAAGLPIPRRPSGAPPPSEAGAALAQDEGRHGTVGVVALDSGGDLAAGTSTGGTTAKRWGRVGDSPVIGAGTYAANASCAVSATGEGEYFIRLAAAREICALVEHKGLSLQAAADQLIHGQLAALGGEGGVIAVAPDGQMAWSFNTSGMYRARIAEDQPLVVGVYEDDP